VERERGAWGRGKNSRNPRTHVPTTPPVSNQSALKLTERANEGIAREKKTQGGKEKC